jgi:hypothetical protein
MNGSNAWFIRWVHGNRFRGDPKQDVQPPARAQLHAAAGSGDRHDAPPTGNALILEKFTMRTPKVNRHLPGRTADPTLRYRALPRRAGVTNGSLQLREGDQSDW